MVSIIRVPVPEESELHRYTVRSNWQGDAFRVDAAQTVSLARLLEVFFRSRVFFPERVLLSLWRRRPLTAATVRSFATGGVSAFGVWREEVRREDQVLLEVDGGTIRTWFMVAPAPDGGTGLYFGSAISVAEDEAGKLFRLIYRFHIFYSRILLRSAVAALRRSRV